METLVGTVIRPWPGESLTGVVCAVSGDRVVCVAPDGLRFEVALEAIHVGRVRKVLTEAPPVVYYTADGKPSRASA